MQRLPVRMSGRYYLRLKEWRRTISQPMDDAIDEWDRFHSSLQRFSLGVERTSQAQPRQALTRDAI